MYVLQVGSLELREEHGQIMFESKGPRGTFGH